jgi:hypothetical protein
VNTEHPITPPPELVQQWEEQFLERPTINGCFIQSYIAAKAAQWGAEQELHAICDWLDHGRTGHLIHPLLCARRPKPPSLNSIALQMLGTIERDAHYIPEITDTIRRALEALDD